jgi:predicted DNA-binding transcriptional regulator AlpA
VNATPIPIDVAFFVTILSLWQAFLAFRKHREIGLMVTNEMDVQDVPALATKKQVAVWARCSTRHIELQVKAGVFPAPIRLGTHPRWRRSALLRWLESQSHSVEAE